MFGERLGLLGRVIGVGQRLGLFGKVVSDLFNHRFVLCPLGSNIILRISDHDQAHDRRNEHPSNEERLWVRRQRKGIVDGHVSKLGRTRMHPRTKRIGGRKLEGGDQGVVGVESSIESTSNDRGWQPQANRTDEHRYQCHNQQRDCRGFGPRPRSNPPDQRDDHCDTGNPRRVCT